MISGRVVLLMLSKGVRLPKKWRGGVSRLMKLAQSCIGVCGIGTWVQ